MHHKKALKNLFSLMIFSKTLTETIPLKKPKKPWNYTLKHGMWKKIYQWE